MSLSTTSSDRPLEFADFLPNLAKTIEGEDDAGRRMDFDSGVLEVHHGRAQGAKNEHRVLVTTYQSQAAEERKYEKSPQSDRE